MKRLLIAVLVAGLLFGPSVPLLAVAVLLHPAAEASCLDLTSTIVGEPPGPLTATTADGRQLTLDDTQLAHAHTIVTIGAQTDGVDHDGILTALMAALTESSLRMLANTSAYPQSATHPNDGDGSNHDSLGLFQMRPQMGWGSVAELMDPTYQARAFYGGPDGPNRGEPRGLLDLPNRHELTLGQAAQAVERSAHPERYEVYEPVARTILTTLTTGTAGDLDSIPDLPGDSIPDLPGQGPRTGCVTVAGLPPAPTPFTGTPGGRLDDPTGTGGWVTRELAHLIIQTRAAFPDTGWACWSPRPGTGSEHPLGRACDVTFGNPIGVFPTAAQTAEGWRMTTWLQTHADALHVQYLIWQGHIWSLTRDDEGWRPYDGGGMHDPATPTGGHYDHLHITTAA
ncbi:hypothetical protein FTX61_13515 [Nitriliruptoraceae bacterium ZYF776]|nr:hypothetical protein [Profundirhabdus halotolerans]